MVASWRTSINSEPMALRVWVVRSMYSALTLFSFALLNSSFVVHLMCLGDSLYLFSHMFFPRAFISSSPYY